MNRLCKVLILLALYFGQSALAQDIVNDVFVEETLSEYVGKSLPTAKVCNHQNLTRVPIVLNSKEVIRSRNVTDGEFYEFVVKKPVIYNHKCIVPKGTIVKGRLETMATKGMNGIPAMMIFDDFIIPGIEPEKLKSYYIKRGLNLTLLVLPLKWALTILPPTGSLTNFIMGGPAKISPRTDITLFYYPEWECSEI